MDRKKILIIAGIIALIIAFGIAAYFVIFRQKTKVASDLPPLTSEEQQRLKLTTEERNAGITEDEKINQYVEEKRKEIALQTSANETNKYRVLPVLNTKTISPTLSADFSKLIYFSPEQKEFFIANLDGSKASPITSSNLDQVYDISWSKKKDRAVITFSDNFGLTQSNMIYDLNNQKQTSIDPNFKFPTLSTDGEKIAYLFEDKNNSTSNISVANLDGTNWNQVSPFSGEDPIIIWNLESKLLYYSQPDNQKNNVVFSANLAGNSFQQLASSIGLSLTLSGDGNKFVYSGANSENSTAINLKSHNLSNNQDSDIGIQTFAEKCVWLPDNTNVICGIPENLNQCQILPNAYYNNNFITRDSFYKINTQTNEKTLIAKSDLFDKDYDVYKPFMLGEKIMYFTRRQDGLVYALVIP